jgi:hypothetical protein
MDCVVLIKKGSLVFLSLSLSLLLTIYTLPVMASSSNPSAEPNDPKAQALTAYRKRLLEHRELDAQLKDGKWLVFVISPKPCHSSVFYLQPALA